MPNILDKITNTLNEYVADAKNIKGTYVVVEYYDDLANLPSATLMSGTIAFVQGNGLYYRYISPNVSPSWENITLVQKSAFSVNINANFDVTQTYTFTVDISDILGYLDGDKLADIFFNFNENISLRFLGGQGLSSGLVFSTNMILVYQNKQYVASVNADLMQQSNNGSLSFQELQAGSGGGGEPITKIKYHIEVEDSNDNKAIIPISKETFDNYLVEMNQVGQTLATALGITWTTINDIDGLKDTFDDLKTGQLSYGCDLAMNLLVKYAYESGENPVLQLPIQDDILANNDLTISNIASYDLITYAPSIILGQVKSLYNNVESSLLQEYVWFKVSPYYFGEQIIIDTNATFTYTSETETYGGGGSGEGSGKLYEINMELTRYDDEGNILPWGTNTYIYHEGEEDEQNITVDNLSGIPITPFNNLSLVFNIYESNFEKIKVTMNQLLQPYSITINTIQDFISYINTYWDETQMDTSGSGYNASQVAIQLMNLYNYVDKAYVYFTIQNNRIVLPVDSMVPVMFAAPGGIRCFGTNEYGNYNFAFMGWGDFLYGLSVNNSCTLTEYGTSGSGGGGTVQTKKWYQIDYNEVDAASGSGSDINQMFAMITEEQMQEILTYISQAMQVQLSTPQDLISLYNSYKMDDYTLSPQTEALFAQLARMFTTFALDSMLNNKIAYFYNDFDGSYDYPTNIFLTGEILNKSNSWFSSTKTWESGKICFSSHSILTITEETETIGGGSSSPTQSKTIYEFTLKTSTDGNAISTNNYNEMYVEISEEKLNEFITELNVIGHSLSPSWVDLKNVDDTISYMNNTDLYLWYTFICKLAKYSSEENRNVFATFYRGSSGDTRDTYIAEEFSMTNEASPLNIYSVDKMWFDDAIANQRTSLFTGGSGGTEVHIVSYETRQEVGSGGSVTPQPSSDSGIDFLKIFAVGNARNLIVTYPKGYLNESAQVTTLNTLISTLNTNFSLSIPSYTNIDDFTNIADYLTTLPNSNPYNVLAKVTFYSNMFWYMNVIALSVKIQLIDGSKFIVQSPVIEALADSQNQQFSYAVRYLDDSGGSLSLETLWSTGSPSETYDFVIYANDIEATPYS